MKKLEKILVATDFSENAGSAICSAAELAQRYDASLLVIHVVEPTNYLLPESYLARSPDHFGETLRGLSALLAKEKTRAEAAGAPRVSAEIVQGVTATEIVAFAKAHACDLIVVGTHGRTGIAHTLLGSIAEKVVRTARCPVLTIPEPPLQRTP